MTSLTTIGPEQQHLEGRSVRDIVEYSPEQVNEVWCRKIFRQILQSLELQYAMHMPHRAITPDTIVFHDNGEPLLIPLDVGPEEAREAEDLNALACIIHYAITRELAPTGPLEGRTEGYSDSLIRAVDRCMGPDPARRPRTIAELRDLLGIVPLGPAVGPAAASHTSEHNGTATDPAVADAQQRVSAPGPGAAPAPRDAGAPSFPPGGERLHRRLSLSLSRWQRWAVAAGGGAILVALALAMFAEMRDSGSFDHIVLTLPQQGDGPRPDAASPAYGGNTGAEATVSAPDVPASAPPGAPPGAPPAGASADVAAASATATGPATAPTTPATAPATASAPAAPAAAPTPQGRLPGVVVTPEGNLYKLRIQPWGVIYVDGVDRGVSPPIKRLALAPGRHTIRVTNPNFHDRVLEVNTASGDGHISVDFNEASR
jgi:hypothetical protein